MTDMIKEIIKREWDFFQQTKNQGGRASCQEDFETFQIMRGSQFSCWTEELCGSYLEDLKEAEQIGRNLITEKYGRMMETAYPQEYEKMKEVFPQHSQERQAITEAIAAIQVEWLEQFAKEFPKAAGQARVIHSTEDTQWDTSAETYLKGELGTYSDRTLLLYGRYIVQLQQEGRNLTRMINEAVAKAYGYADMAAMEAALI